jgi:hypothetical protein
LNATVLREGNVTVVLDGVARLRWSRRGSDEWLLCGLWPTGEEQRAVLQRLAAGHPLLVVLEQGPATVSVYRQEVAADLDRFESVIESGPLLELAVPVLDWLPEPLATHGRNFVACADELVRTTAKALLPALIMDDGGGPPTYASRGVRLGRSQHPAVSMRRVRCSRRGLPRLPGR